jgi:hypothetical protein
MVSRQTRGLITKVEITIISITERRTSREVPVDSILVCDASHPVTSGIAEDITAGQ